MSMCDKIECEHFMRLQEVKKKKKSSLQGKSPHDRDSLQPNCAARGPRASQSGREGLSEYLFCSLLPRSVQLIRDSFGIIKIFIFPSTPVRVSLLYY